MKKLSNSAEAAMLLARRRITICLVAAMLIVVFCDSLARANVILFDHFDGTAAGEAFGSVSFVPSQLGLGQAVNLEQGDWIRYALPSWYSYGWGAAQGTIEMWIKPCQYSSILTLQWDNVTSPPSSGYVGHFVFDPEGKLGWGVWNGQGDGGIGGETTIPLNEWTHIAVTWGSDGTKLYVNGAVDASTSANVWPALRDTTYVYLNYWGGSDLGYVDEFRILDTYVPEPTTICLLGLGALSLVRRKK